MEYDWLFTASHWERSWGRWKPKAFCTTSIPNSALSFYSFSLPPSFFALLPGFLLGLFRPLGSKFPHHFFLFSFSTSSVPLTASSPIFLLHLLHSFLATFLFSLSFTILENKNKSLFLCFLAKTQANKRLLLFGEKGKQ